MSRTGRGVFIVVLALSVAATMIAGLRTVSGPEYTQAQQADHVLVVGVPALNWESITPDAMPHLWEAADEGAVGMVTPRSARSVTCPWDGWLTVGAGNRARYPATIPDSELRSEDTANSCLGQQGSVPIIDGSQIGPAVAENRSLSYGAEPGALGTAVSCTSIVGDGPILAVGVEGADVRHAPGGANPAEWAELMGQCPLTLVAPDHALDRSTAELQALDAELGSLLEGARDQGATVIIVGTSQPEYKSSQLHAVIVANSNFQQQVLSSASTSRAPFSQVIDIAPTVLAILDEPRPPSMVGQALRAQDRTQDLEDLASQFHSESMAASTHVVLSSEFFAFLTFFITISAVLLAGLVFVRRSGNSWSRALGIVAGLLPVASLVANAYPWWDTASPSASYAITLGLTWALLSAVALLGPWRQYRSGPLVAVCAITFGVLGIDVLSGSQLQLNSPLGYNAIVAGRFTGFGNMTFAMFGAAALVLLACACSVLATRTQKTIMLGAAGIALVAMVGAPGAGMDFGGVVSIVPSAMLLWLLVTKYRMSPIRLVLLFGSGLLAVMSIAIADYLRPANDRTHLGRFIGQILDGTAWTIVTRKLESNWGILTGSVLTLLAVTLGAIVAWQWLSRRSAAHIYAGAHAPYASAAAISVAVLAVLGFAVNDSGIAVTAVALAVVVPPVLGILGGDEHRWGSPVVDES